MLLILAALVVAGAATIAATQRSDAVGFAAIAVVPFEYDLTGVDAGADGVDDGGDPTDLASGAIAAYLPVGAGVNVVEVVTATTAFPTSTVAGSLAPEAVNVGAPAGTIARVPSLGGAIDITIVFTNAAGAVADPGAADQDIITITTTAGGINSATGGTTAVMNSYDFDAATLPTPHGGVGTNVDGGAFSLFSGGVAATATLSVNAGGIIGDDTIAGVGNAPVVEFVGPVSTATFAAPRTAGLVAVAGANPAPSVNGDAPFQSGAAAGLNSVAAPGQHLFYVITADADGRVGLDGTTGNLTLSNITGGATILASTGSVGAAPLAVTAVTTNDEAALFGAIADAGTESAAQHGNLAFAVLTTAGTAASGTLTVNLLGFGSASDSVDFIASGNGATVTLSDAAAGDLNISEAGAGANPVTSRLITLVDANGNAATGTTAQLDVGQTTTGALDFGVGATIALAETNANAAVGTTSGAGVIAASGLTEIAGTGTFPLGIASAAALPATAPGTYELTVTVTVAAVVVDTVSTTVTVSGAATLGVLGAITDAGGVDVSAAPAVGQGGILNVSITWTDALSNPIPSGTAVALGTPVNNLLTNTANAASDDTGAIVYSLVAGTVSGLGTQTFQSPGGTAASIQFVVEVGGSGGNNPDGLVASGDTTIEASIGDQVQLTVVASSGGTALGSAIILFESGTTTPAPSQSSTSATGEASAFVTSGTAGTVVVSATAVTEGATSLIPVAGVSPVIFTITFGATTVALADGATATFTTWSGGDTTASQVFENVTNLVIVHKFTGDISGPNGGWAPYTSSPNAPAALKENYTLSNGDILFIITDGAVTISVS